MSNVIKITRAEYPEYLKKIDLFKVDKLESNTNGEGRSSWLGFDHDGSGKNMKRVYIDTQQEFEYMWGVGRKIDEKTGVTKHSTACSVDDVTKEFLDAIDNRCVDQLHERSIEFFGMQKSREAIEEGYTRMVHANFNADTGKWGSELLRAGFKVPGKGVKQPTNVFDFEGNKIDMKDVIEGVDGVKHPFKGVPLLNPMFIWKGDKMSTGLRVYVRQIIRTGEIKSMDTCEITLPTELLDSLLKRKREEEEAASLSKDKGEEGEEEEEGEVKGGSAISPPSLKQQRTVETPESPGW